MITEKTKKKPSKFRRIVNYALGGLLALHLATQANYTLHDLYNRFFPDRQRKEFVKEFGFPIRGFDDDINKLNLSVLGEVIYKERLERPFHLYSIVIESDNYFKKSIPQQLEFLLMSGHSGYYNPLTKNIVLTSASPITLHHEIKHRKTFEILKSYPEFLNEWKNLAKDDSGNSLYTPDLDWMLLKFRLLNKLVKDDHTNDYENNKKNGFVSSYARTDVYEDIAELCESAETMSLSGGASQFYNYPEETGPKLKARVKLAQEYGLIPKEFEEFMDLSVEYRNSWGEFGSYYGEKAKEFLQSVDGFLTKYPNSVYVGDLRYARAHILERLLFRYYLPNDAKSINELIDANKDVLNSPYNDNVSYAVSLSKIRDLYEVLGDTANARLYQRADSLYSERWLYQNFPSIARLGVNDFLKGNEKGAEK